MAQYFRIGKIAAVYGVQGEMILQHSLGKRTSLKGLTVFFIEEKKDSFFPYFITSSKIKNEQENFLSVEGIHSREAARPLLKKEVWLAEADFKKFASGAFPLSLLGYTIINGRETLGEITEVIEQPHQLLATIQYGGREVFIPLHEASLEKVDSKNRKVYVTLPEGLLEIYK